MDGPRTLGPDPTTSAGDSGVQVGAVTFSSGERTRLGDRSRNYRRRPGANDFGNGWPWGRVCSSVRSGSAENCAKSHSGRRLIVRLSVFWRRGLVVAPACTYTIHATT